MTYMVPIKVSSPFPPFARLSWAKLFGLVPVEVKGQGPGLDQRRTLKKACTPPTIHHHTNFVTTSRVHRKLKVNI